MRKLGSVQIAMGADVELGEKGVNSRALRGGWSSGTLDIR